MTQASDSDFRGAYIQLLKLCLTGLTTDPPYSAVARPEKDVEIIPLLKLQHRLEGRDWPANGLTMIGMKRLENLQMCVDDALQNDVPGDFIETGVWRGGASIFMRALLKVHNDTDRVVHVADSFEGFPPPDKERYPRDVPRASEGKLRDYLSVPLEAVQANFGRFDLLDDQVRFVKGWFRDTLPSLSDKTWAVIRLDGDMYESTFVALENLYPNVSMGGYVIIDDYALQACRWAVHDYRDATGITDEIHPIDWSGAYWKKS